MSKLAHRAEIIKLARLLGTPPEQLDYLDKLDTLAIRRVREQATAALFDPDRKMFQRVATASRLMPAAVTALIAEKALGPLLCARVTGLMAPDRAVDISSKLKTGFLADLCLELDPRSAREVLEAMPVPRIVEVGQELARRKEYITMARFVDSLGDEAIRAVMNALRDDEALLRIGFFVEDSGRLSAIIDLLQDPRLRNIVGVAVAGDAALWPEALALINSVEPPQRRRMAALAAGLDDAAVARMLQGTDTHGLWTELQSLLGLLDEAARARTARIAAGLGPQLAARLDQALRPPVKPAA
jgi:hypothetical protein